eukprot:TRINITY_DN63344_c0_g1_i1.p1 TRINITY_DN63344_c0_g1~~TRINITY_DN63344_c0_g1_i1.p1  ORF type:complete len:189 (+),score=24.30 TRINITY_DN63344_c0_g1_i1:71-568(+)
MAMQERKVAFMVTVCLYFLHLAATLLGIIPSSHPPEDAVLGLGLGGPPPAHVDPWDAAHRWHSIAENQKENFPMQLFIIWGSVLVGEMSDDLAKDSKNKFFMIGYVLLRAAYAVCYRCALAPWRSIVFAGATWLCIFPILVIGCMRCFSVASSRETKDGSYTYLQ